MDIKIIVAAHRKFDMPTDPLYLPLHVGAALASEQTGFARDDEGENISDKNRNFCELTGIYWAWKNLDADCVGLAHYRRHFGKKRDRLLSLDEAKKIFEGCDVIVPSKRKYYIESLYSHYDHTMHIEPLDITGKIIGENCPEYSAEFERLKKRTSAHMFNMFVMKKELFDSYCEWLFGILFELEKRVDASEYDAFHARFYGRVSELLLDVWLNTNGIKAKEYPFVYMEKVNWFKKGGSFLMAKFFKKKYDKSF